MKKQFLAIGLALCLALCCLSITALATVNPDTRDTRGYFDETLPQEPEKAGDVWTVTPENAQYTLDGAYGSINGKTICFARGEYTEQLILGRVNKFSGSNSQYFSNNWTKEIAYNQLQDTAIYQYLRQVKGVVFIAEEGVVLPGFTASSGHMYGATDDPAVDYVRETSTESTNHSYYASSQLEKIVFQGLQIAGGISINDYSVNASTQDILFVDCRFLGDVNRIQDSTFCAVGMKADEKTFANIRFSGCTFTNYFQGIYIQGAVDPSISGCLFQGTTHNAIALQSSRSNPLSGDVYIGENIIENAEDRAIRLGDTEMDSLVIENNIILDSGDDEGQLIKAGAINGNPTVSLEYNYWNGRDTAEAVADGLPQPAVTGIKGGHFAQAILAAYCAPGFVPVADGEGGYTVAADTSFFAGGSGSANDPYRIADVTQLAAFRDSVNRGVTYAGLHIRLEAADYNLSGQEWTPIGDGARNGKTYSGAAFQGTFDGNNQTISQLTITADAANVNDAIGLFGVVDGGAVKNLHLSQVNIQVANGQCVGGAIGLMVNGAQANAISVSGAISAARGNGGIAGRLIADGAIIDCINEAKITGTSASGNVGGIVGAAYYSENGADMRISGCENHGEILGVTVVGGIVGLSAADVSQCLNSAAVKGAGFSVGGIAGEQQNVGSITDCENQADIVNDSNAYGTGGIVGWVRYSGSESDYPRKEIIQVSNNRNLGAIQGGNDGGGIIGTVYNAIMVTGNENAAAAISGATFAAGIAGNLQFTETAIGDIPQHDITIFNNVSSTRWENISVNGSCKDLYVYHNAATQGKNHIQDNTPAWQGQLEDQKYASLATAVKTAQPGQTVIMLNDVEADVWQMIWNVQGIVLDGKNHTLKVNAIESKENHDAVFHSNGDNLFQNLIVDLSAIDKESAAQGFRAFNAAGGDRFVHVKIIGSNHVSYGIFAGGSDNEEETVSIYDCQFENCQYAIGSEPIANSGGKSKLENLIVSQCQFSGCNYVAILYPQHTEFTENTVSGGKLNIMHPTQTISGNTFSQGSRIKFYDAPQVFSQNNISPDSYLEIVSGISPVNVAKNYWGGGQPNQTQIPDEIRDLTSGSDEYYTQPSMRPSDLNTYVPPQRDDSSSDYRGDIVWVTHMEHGKITASPQRAEAGETITLTVKADQGYALEEISVCDKNGDELKLSNQGDGVYTFRMPDGQATVKAGFVPTAAENASPFADVAENAWYAPAVRFVYENGLMNGTGNASFSPNLAISRGMIVTILYRLEGQPGITAACPFTDVAQGSYYQPAIIWANQNHIVEGYGGGLFGPGDSITREQLAAILYRYAQYKAYDVSQGGMAIREFADYEAISSWAVESMAWAVNAGLISGMGDGTLNPQGYATRAQAAQILMHFCQNIVK